MKSYWLYILAPAWMPIAAFGAIIGFIAFVFCASFKVAFEHDWKLIP